VVGQHRSGADRHSGGVPRLLDHHSRRHRQRDTSGVSALNGWAVGPASAPRTRSRSSICRTRTLVRTVALAAGLRRHRLPPSSTIRLPMWPIRGSIPLPGQTTSPVTPPPASRSGAPRRRRSITRGRLFVLNGNLPAMVPPGPSWISIVDPLTNRLATGIDSILAAGPGNCGDGGGRAGWGTVRHEQRAARRPHRGPPDADRSRRPPRAGEFRRLRHRAGSRRDQRHRQVVREFPIPRA